MFFILAEDNFGAEISISSLPYQGLTFCSFEKSSIKYEQTKKF